jgi:hypothetical protein
VLRILISRYAVKIAGFRLLVSVPRDQGKMVDFELGRVQSAIAANARDTGDGQWSSRSTRVAPEVETGGFFSAKSDVWAFGSLIAEVLHIRSARRAGPDDDTSTLPYGGGEREVDARGIGDSRRRSGSSSLNLMVRASAAAVADSGDGHPKSLQPSTVSEHNLCRMCSDEATVCDQHASLVHIRTVDIRACCCGNFTPRTYPSPGPRATGCTFPWVRCACGRWKDSTCSVCLVAL